LLFFGFLDYFLVRCLFEGLAKQHKGQDLTLCHFSQFRVANLFLVAFCLLWVWSFARKHSKNFGQMQVSLGEA
jgi:F0F1-type ATP synthase assembly protein I